MNYQRDLKRILSGLLLFFLAVVLLCLLSCGTARRIATQTETTDRTTTQNDRETTTAIRTEGVSLTQWMEQLSREVSSSWTWDFDSARLSPGGIILYGGRGEGASSAQEQSRVQRADTVYISVQDTSRMAEHTTVQADVETSTTEKPLPIPRTAMWVCITVAIVVGYLVFRRLIK
mgnify:FL=1